MNCSFELFDSRPVFNDIDTTVGSANTTFYEWRTKQMKNPEIADECYRLECAYQVELCRMQREWSIKELAKRLSVSKSFVKAVIKSEVQLTVYEFIRWLRVMGYETKIETKDLETESADPMDGSRICDQDGSRIQKGQ